MGSWFIEKTGSMKATGSMTRGRRRAMRGTPMATGMKAISNKEKLMAKVSLSTRMAHSMMETGYMISNTVRVERSGTRAK